MRPVCVACKMPMKCNKNGRFVEVRSGDEPYQLWDGDEWMCPVCGVSIVTGFGIEPVSYWPNREGYMQLRNHEEANGNLVVLEG